MQPQLSMMLTTFSAEDPGDWRHLVDLAQAADAAGVDRLALTDHVVFGENLDAYGDPAKGGIRGGSQPTGPDGLWLEPLATIAHLTAVTTRVRFATNILLAALRRPVVLAKMAATIDVLSGGRLDLGVGVGWQREEYEAAGLSYERRGRLLDHTIEVCQALWQNSATSYDSEGLQFSKIHQMPKPLQSGGVPVWVSGTVNPGAMQRLARFGIGWIPWGDDAADVPGGIARMRAAVAELGRDPADIQIMGSLPVVPSARDVPDLERTMAAVPALLAAGVTDVRVRLPVPGERDAATEYLADVVSRFRAVC